MPLTHYSAKEIRNIIKQLDNKVYNDLKDLSDDDQRYLGSIYLQSGGNNITDIQRGTKEMKLIVNRLINTFHQFKQIISLSNNENDDLKKQIVELKNKVEELSSCDSDIDKANDHIQKFLTIRQKLATVVGQLQFQVQKGTKPEFITNDDISEYENLLSLSRDVDVQQDINCKNVKSLQKTLNQFTNPNIFQRILNDFEDINGTVRVFIRIVNRSLFDINKQIQSKQFNHKILTSSKSIKKVQQKFTYKCNKDKCLSPPSIQKIDNQVHKTNFPCNEDDTFVNFKPFYGPFFSVHENVDNNTFFNGSNNDNGLKFILMKH